MKYLFKLNKGEIIDGLISNYLIPKHDKSDVFLKRILQSFQTKFGYSLRESVEFVIEMGKKQGHKYTFFIVGKLARDNPGLVEYVLKNGHEVGSHSLQHVIPCRLDKESFYEELIESKKILESQGAKVSGFRAPHLLLNDSQYELIAKAGYRYSSSKLWDHHPIEYGNGDYPITEIPVTFEDWTCIKYRGDPGKLTKLVSDAARPGSVMLLHATFLASENFKDLWGEVLVVDKKRRSVSLQEQYFNNADTNKQNISITIDLGLGRW